jgi:hypothetical protein
VALGYYTRVLSKHAAFPPFEALVQVIQEEHPGYQLTLEEGSAQAWETLLLSGDDGTAVAAIERNPVLEDSLGKAEIAEFLEEIKDCKPASGVAWLQAYLNSVQTIYAFQHLAGADTDEGFEALHALRFALWGRGDAIIQADLEGFTNEEGCGIVWQFSDSVTGPWNMGVHQDGKWRYFEMDLGNAEHRAAFLRGEVPAGVAVVPAASLAV